MKIPCDYDKLRGGYYTPEILTEFIAKRMIQSSTDTVLEPSCGDGGFLRAVQKRFCQLSEHNQKDSSLVGDADVSADGAKGKDKAFRFLGIEREQGEAEKAAQIAAKAPGCQVVAEDFFTYYYKHIRHKQAFDVVVGNPPFIRYQNIDASIRELAFSMLQEAGFSPNRLTNLWMPFLILSALALKPEGRLGMVIPAELFQVNYAAEAREFLTSYFERLTVITFRRLVFDDIQQEVVVLLGERTSKEKGIQTLELENAEELWNLTDQDFRGFEVKELEHSSEKWVKYYLSNEEIQFMRKMGADPRISAAEELFEVNVGLVSGENDFFLLNREGVSKFHLEESVKQIIGRTEQLRGIILREGDLSGLRDAKKKVYLFAPENKPKKDLKRSEQKYIRYGEKKGYHKGYKCRIRKHWYIVPQSWEPDAFILRQVHKYPRMIFNEASALSTDTIHKVRFKEGVSGRQVAGAFLNSYTLALGEITGRSYGGGVLTFEPGEIRKLRIPMRGAGRLAIENIDRLVREDQMYEALDAADQILLKEELSLEDEEIRMLRRIWEKLRDRRLYRKASR